MRPLPQSCLMSATLFLVVPLLGACSSMYYATMEKFGVVQTELDGAAYADALAKERAAYARIIEKAGIKVP